MPRARRQYSDEEKAATLAALRANAGNVSKTARQCGVPRPTLIGWVNEQEALGMSRQSDTQPTPEKKDRSTAERVAAVLPTAKALLAGLYEEATRDLLAIVKAKGGDLTADKAMVAAAVATDKMLLLRAQPPGDPTYPTGDLFAEIRSLSPRPRSVG